MPPRNPVATALAFPHRRRVPASEFSRTSCVSFVLPGRRGGRKDTPCRCRNLQPSKQRHKACNCRPGVPTSRAWGASATCSLSSARNRVWGASGACSVALCRTMRPPSARLEDRGSWFVATVDLVYRHLRYQIGQSISGQRPPAKPGSASLAERLDSQRHLPSARPQHIRCRHCDLLAASLPKLAPEASDTAAWSPALRWVGLLENSHSRTRAPDRTAAMAESSGQMPEIRRAADARRSCWALPIRSCGWVMASVKACQALLPRSSPNRL
mmetsp:Transcript_53771/g.144834  ORF Transcript_53771/g.144834 Transcript_53771/m.144834 type:complete len:270 (+) Transcript_53771:217-1026(+)